MGTALATLPLLLAGLTAQGPQAADEVAIWRGNGYSLSCPDGWLVLSPKQSADITETLQRLLPDAMIGADDVDVFVFASDEPGAANVNVRVQAGAIPVDAEHEADLLAAMRNGYSARGIELRSELALERRRIADCEAYVLEYTAAMPNIGAEFRQRQLLISAVDRTLVVTFTGPIDRFEECAAGFDTITATLAIEKPEGLLATWRALPGLVRGGLLGALLGLVAAIVKRRFDLRKERRAA